MSPQPRRVQTMLRTSPMQKRARYLLMASLVALGIAAFAPSTRAQGLITIDPYGTSMTSGTHTLQSGSFTFNTGNVLATGVTVGGVTPTPGIGTSLAAGQVFHVIYQ